MGEKLEEKFSGVLLKISRYIIQWMEIYMEI